MKRTISPGGLHTPRSYGGTPPINAAFYACYNYTNTPPSAMPWADLDLVLYFAVPPRINSTTGDSEWNQTQFVGMLDADITAMLAAKNAVNPACKVMLTLGAANTDSAFKTAIRNPNGKGTEQLAAHAAELVSTFGFDGVDIDWEIPSLGPVGSTWTDYYIYYRLMERLRFEMGPTKQIYLDWGRPGPNDGRRAITKRLLDRGLADYLLLTTYHMSVPATSSGSKVWHHTALHYLANGIYPTGSDYGSPTDQISIDRAVKEFCDSPGSSPAGFSIPRNMTIVCAQCAGKLWGGGATGNGGGVMTGPAGSAGRGSRYPLDTWVSGGTVPTLNTVATITQGTEKLYRHIIQRSDYGNVLRDMAAGNQPFLPITGATAADDGFLSFDDPGSIQTKCEYVLEQGLAGFAQWEIDGQYISGATGRDKHPLIKAARDTLDA